MMLRQSARVRITQQSNKLYLLVKTKKISQLIMLRSSSSELQKPKLRWRKKTSRKLELLLEHSSSIWLITIDLLQPRVWCKMMT
ncbi:NSs protein [Botambi virus]|uniref:Non-structural protein NS-S n=1 Tax=Botambi virus TaxID=2849744 RepID=A0AAX3JJ45_9VIRU|nr:NSs protein [Botambi virus]WAD86872.1 NSs protein [Botambi virus]